MYVQILLYKHVHNLCNLKGTDSHNKHIAMITRVIWVEVTCISYSMYTQSQTYMYNCSITHMQPADFKESVSQLNRYEFCDSIIWTF